MINRHLLGVVLTFGLAAFAFGQQPNIVLIVADDAGFVDFGFQGSSVIPTPSLDQLASQGVRFSNAYIQSVCSPSRAILATGLYGGRFGYEQNIPSSSAVIGTSRTIGLAPEQTTVFDRLKGLGYQNFVVGKWHLGLHADDVQGNTLIAPGNRPTQQGVDEFFGLLGGSRPYFVGDQNSLPNRLIVETLNGFGAVQETIVEGNFAGQYITDVIGDKTSEYISNQAGQGPFFVFSSFTAPHTPLQAKPDDLAAIDAMNLGLSGNRRVYAAMQFAMDRAIGNILARIDDPNNDGDTRDSIADETLIFFINDNGGDCCDSNTNASFNGNLRNGKGSIFEGGVRVPMLVAGAGINPASQGTDFEPAVHAGDIVATCFAAGGGAIEPGMFDGVDLRPFVNGTAVGDPHDVVYLRRPSNLGIACRSGDFKLFHDRNNGFALFDLSTNPGENFGQNLINQMPELVDSLKRRVTDFDVQFVKRRWSSDNLDANEFRFLEGAFQSANWNTLNAWSNLTDDNNDGERRLREDDGNSSTRLIFRAKNGGDFVATNNLTRANGLEFMANNIRFITRPEGLNGSRNGIINGLPVLLAASPDGQQPAIQLDSFDASTEFMTFEWQSELMLYDDIAVSGNGNDVYIFSGNISEYRAARNLTKTGNSILRLQGNNAISGTIEINQGTIRASTPAALGSANLKIMNPGILNVDQTLQLQGERVLSGDGQLIANLTNEGIVSAGSDKAHGTLSLQGEYLQTINGTLQIDVNDVNQFDQLAVSQNASLAGELVIDIGSEIAAGTEIQVVTVDGNVNGTFNTFVFSGPGSWQVDYREDGVWIVSTNAKSDPTNIDSILISNGQELFGDVTDLEDSDDNNYVILADAPSATFSPIDFIATASLPNDAPSSISLEIESAANTTNLSLTVEAFNFDESEFQLVAEESLADEQQSQVFKFPSDSTHFVQDSTNQIVVRLQIRPEAPILFFPWQYSLDRMVWLSNP